ncbi:hypothetical protein ACET3Z_019086 [Daucus carota]
MKRALLQAEEDIRNTMNYMYDIHELGLTIKQHEDHIKFLRTRKNILADSILDMQVATGKYYTATESVTEKEDTQIEEGTSEHLNGLLCQLKAHIEFAVSHNPLVKDVLGIVATLGNVHDENLSRLLGEYLGTKAMFAVVCKTLDGVKALESYDEGVLNTDSDLHGIGSSLGRILKGRFRVICLEDLRPYDGEFIAGDLQRRLDLLKPKLPGGEIPRGFVGYAVNLVNVDIKNLFCVTTSGHGLRETLFYNLFSHLQVYRTREDMQQALPFITDGAVSLDGGIIRTPGVFDLGDREAQVKFQRISGKSSLPESFYKIENSLESKIRDQESLLANICQTQSLLDEAKSNYEMKKGDFLHFLAQRSAAQYSPAETYEDDLQKLGLRVKQHEDHLKFLRTQINIIKGSIQDLRVTIRKHTSTESVSENEDARSEEGTYEQLIQEKSAAGLICQLKALHETPVSQNPVVKDVLGIVATLGNVDDDNLSRLLAEYLGKKVMLALVCQTFDGVKALEAYDEGGVINRNSGLHEIASSIGRTLEGRYHVICLDELTPYAGNFLPDDPQKRLDLLNPELPGGEIPFGFIGYAVNLVFIDYQNVSWVTTSGHGLRETLFYHLFSHLQVYRTMEDMYKALPLIKHGAVSLDGGIIRSPGVIDLGDWEAQVKFQGISGKSSLPENYKIESILKGKFWEKESNSTAQQQQSPTGRGRVTPRRNNSSH